MLVRRAATRVRWAGMASHLGLGRCEGDDALKSCRHHWRDALQSVCEKVLFFLLIGNSLRTSNEKARFLHGPECILITVTARCSVAPEAEAESSRLDVRR